MNIRYMEVGGLECCYFRVVIFTASEIPGSFGVPQSFTVNNDEPVEQRSCGSIATLDQFVLSTVHTTVSRVNQFSIQRK